MATKEVSPQPPPRNVRPSDETDDGRKDHPCSGGFLSSDGFLWTDTNPDVKLIEPRLLVSVNYNYLEFSRKDHRPPIRRSVCLINHGDHPVAFQVQTTDNYSYFVDRKHGVIPPRQCSVNASVRMANVAIIQVSRRPHMEYPPGDRGNFFNAPHKDKMFILLAPQICQTFSPEAIFHNERSYEKLRIMLRYSGIVQKANDTKTKQQLLTSVPGWSTWKNSGFEMKEKQNTQEYERFRLQESRIIKNASREVLEQEILKRPPAAPILRKFPLVSPVVPVKKSAENPKKKDGIVKNFLKKIKIIDESVHEVSTKEPVQVVPEQEKPIVNPVPIPIVNEPVATVNPPVAAVPASKRAETTKLGVDVPSRVKSNEKDRPTPPIVRKSLENDARSLDARKNEKEKDSLVKKSKEKVKPVPSIKKKKSKEKVNRPVQQTEEKKSFPEAKDKEKIVEAPSPDVAKGTPVSPNLKTAMMKPKLD